MHSANSFAQVETKLTSEDLAKYTPYIEPKKTHEDRLKQYIRERNSGFLHKYAAYPAFATTLEESCDQVGDIYLSHYHEGIDNNRPDLCDLVS